MGRAIAPGYIWGTRLLAGLAPVEEVLPQQGDEGLTPWPEDERRPLEEAGL